MFLKESVFVVVLIIGVSQCANNVCKSYEDYQNIDNSKNCWYDPDINMTPEETVKKQGLDFETHKVETGDGYILNLFRVKRKDPVKYKTPLFLHHGIASSAMCFMTAGNRSLAFYLAKAGYDVWLGNIRGNPYSDKHSSMTMLNPKFWDFSFHEVGLNDIPATLEYINKTVETNSKIIFIGHSMGSTISYVYASLMKKHAEKYLKAIISVAPVASLKHYSSPLKQYLPAGQGLISQFKSQNVHVLFPDPAETRSLFLRLCSQQRTAEDCAYLLSILMGPDDGNVLPQDILAMASCHPARSSLKTFEHYSQIMTLGAFRQFDYGPDGNLAKYNSTVPPDYRLDEIELPVHIFFGKNDFLSNEQDAELVFEQLQTGKKSINVIPRRRKNGYNHMDFFYGEYVKPDFYKPFLRLLRKL